MGIKMKKTIISIITLMFIFTLFPFVTAELCKEITDQECNIVTPILDCNYYEIYSINDTLIKNSTNMSLIDSNIYSFEFNESVGEYVIKLCDGTTRQIEVEDENMLELITIVLIIMLIGFFFIVLAEYLKNDFFLFFAGSWFFGMSFYMRNITILFSEYIGFIFFVMIGTVCFVLTYTRKRNKDAKYKAKVQKELEEKGVNYYE